MTRGARHCRFSNLQSRRLAAPFIMPALDQHVEYHPGLVHGAPEPVFRPDDLETCRPRQPTADLIGEVLAELVRPLSHGLMADDDAARAASISSTIRKLSRKRKHNQTAGANGCRYRVRLPALLPIRKPASSQANGTNRTPIVHALTNLPLPKTPEAAILAP
jgi:hypothetical protein